MDVMNIERTAAIVSLWLGTIWYGIYVFVYLKLDPVHKIRLQMEEEYGECDDKSDAEAKASRPAWMKKFYHIWAPVSYGLIAFTVIMTIISIDK